MTNAVTTRPRHHAKGRLALPDSRDMVLTMFCVIIWLLSWCVCVFAQVITALSAMDGSQFGYALGNGTVGMYKQNIRLWRIKVTTLSNWTE